MCGRFCLDVLAEEVIATFALRHNVILTPRYNIAPSQVVPVIRKLGALDFMPWGLRPAWLKPDRNPFINARIETLQEKPSFKQAFKQRRCLIIATGYYEWKQIGSVKQPYFISVAQQKLFALAGIWDGEGCCIITQAAKQQDLMEIHDRMPLIINPEHYALWLNHALNAAELLEQVQNKTPRLIAYPVSTKVNSPQHDSAECIKSLH